jgi:hypothetical protein
VSQLSPHQHRMRPTLKLKRVQDAAPTLDRNAGHHKYSQAFKDIIESCLNKDPALRSAFFFCCSSILIFPPNSPTAAQLLATPFFKSAKKKSFLVGPNGILTDLPPLTQRQERHKVASPTLSIKTMDSWDFTTTTGHGRSSTASIVSLGNVRGHVRNSTGSAPSHRLSPTTSVFGKGPTRTASADFVHERPSSKDRSKLTRIGSEDVIPGNRRRKHHTRSVSSVRDDLKNYESPHMRGTKSTEVSPDVHDSPWSFSPSDSPVDGVVDLPLNVVESPVLPTTAPSEPATGSKSPLQPVSNPSPPTGPSIWRKLIQGQSKSIFNDDADAGSAEKRSLIARKAHAGRKAFVAAITTNRER